MYCLAGVYTSQTCGAIDFGVAWKIWGMTRAVRDALAVDKAMKMSQRSDPASPLERILRSGCLMDPE